MRVQCAWCKKEMAEKPPYDDRSITHSICINCLKKVLKASSKPAIPPPEFKEQLRERLT